MKKTTGSLMLAMAIASIACMTASCAEFVGELYWAEWNSKYDCGFGLHGREKWDGGERGFDEYMEVDGVKYLDANNHFS